MITSVTIDYSEVLKYQKEIENLQKDKKGLQKQILELLEEIKFLKNSGDDILVIIKNGDNTIRYEFIEKEKKSITDIITTANELINKNEQLKTDYYNIKSHEEVLKIELTEEIKENDKLRNELKKIESRGFWARVKNK